MVRSALFGKPSLPGDDVRIPQSHWLPHRKRGGSVASRRGGLVAVAVNQPLPCSRALRQVDGENGTEVETGEAEVPPRGCASSQRRGTYSKFSPSAVLSWISHNFFFLNSTFLNCCVLFTAALPGLRSESCILGNANNCPGSLDQVSCLGGVFAAFFTRWNWGHFSRFDPARPRHLAGSVQSLPRFGRL